MCFASGYLLVSGKAGPAVIHYSNTCSPLMHAATLQCVSLCASVDVTKTTHLMSVGKKDRSTTRKVSLSPPLTFSPLQFSFPVSLHPLICPSFHPSFLRVPPSLHVLKHTWHCARFPLLILEALVHFSHAFPFLFQLKNRILTAMYTHWLHCLCLCVCRYKGMLTVL